MIGRSWYSGPGHGNRWRQSVAGVGQDIRLGDDLVAFVARGLSIVVASTHGAGETALGRALGIRVGADRQSLTVLLATAPNGAVLDAIAATGSIAVALTEPTTHRAIQVKGRDARIVPPPADAAAFIAAHIDAFVDEVESMGFAEPLTRALMDHDPAGVVAVAFRPIALFEQTPGPQAGRAVAS